MSSCTDAERTMEDILDECNVSEDDYYNAFDTSQRKLAIHYKRRPTEKNISPYNTVILSLIKSNMNPSICDRYLWTPHLLNIISMQV